MRRCPLASLHTWTKSYSHHGVSGTSGRLRRPPRARHRRSPPCGEHQIAVPVDRLHKIGPLILSPRLPRHRPPFQQTSMTHLCPPPLDTELLQPAIATTRRSRPLLAAATPSARRRLPKKKPRCSVSHNRIPSKPVRC